MIELKIILKNYDDIEAFSEAIKDCDYDIFLVSGNSKVNAKSTLGIYCLDHSNPMTLLANTDSDDALAEKLAPFIER